MVMVATDEHVPKQNADEGWDTYQERVLRNEGRLEGLEQLVRETRAADAKLVGQRSDSLAKELEEAAGSLRSLMQEQRSADKEEFRAELGSAKELNDVHRVEQEKRLDQVLALFREITSTALQKNFDQSNAQIEALQNIMAIWRETDKEARLLQAEEYARRLSDLNHEHQRTAEVLARSVTQEVFHQSTKSLDEKIGVVDRAILTMPTNASMAATVDGINKRVEQASKTHSDVSEAKSKVMEDKLADLKDSANKTEGATNERLTKIETAVLTTEKNQGVTFTQVSLLFGLVGLILTLVVMFSNGVFSPS